MSELNQEEQQQEEVRENSEQDTLKLGVSRRTFIGAGMTAAAAALVLPRQAQGITELIEGSPIGVVTDAEASLSIPSIPVPVAFDFPEFQDPPNKWSFCDSNGLPAAVLNGLPAAKQLHARNTTLSYDGISGSASVRVFHDPDHSFDPNHNHQVGTNHPVGTSTSPPCPPQVRTNAQEVLPGPTIAQQEVLLGPTIICDRGGVIDFELTNYLPAQDFNEASCHELHEKNLIEGSSEPGCFEEFSMHFHGLHVSPRSSAPNTSGISEFSSDHIFAPLVPYNGEDNPQGPEGELLYTKRRFCLAIPEFHAPGTHWYHTHLHGTTAVQTSNGMAGAIIIREPEDQHGCTNEFTSLEVNKENDRIWLIQEFVENIHDGVPQKDEEFYFKKINIPGDPDIPGDPPVKNRGRFLVNGQYVPTLNITAGRPQRWRFINATGTPRGPMQLKLYKLNSGYCDDIGTKPLLDKLHEELRGKPKTETEEKVPGMLVGDQEAMYLIAVDGISFYGHNAQKVGPDSNHDDYKEGWKFAPGNRADFLVNLQEGKYYVLRDQYMKLYENDTGMGGQIKSNKTEYRQVLAFINVESSGTGRVDSDLSYVEIEDNRPNYLRPICDTELQNSPVDNVGCMDKPRIIDFAVKKPEFAVEEPADFAVKNPEFAVEEPAGEDLRKGLYEINSKQFNSEISSITVGLNTAERWLLRNFDCGLSKDNPPNDVDSDGRPRPVAPYREKSAPHPFHIHVNPFQVEGELIDPDPSKGDGPSNWRWRDVLAVDFEGSPEVDLENAPSQCAGPDTVLGEFGENANDYEDGYAQKEYDDHTKYKMIRNRFADFDGEYVVHCHILIHEDQGMMRKLIVEGNEEFTVEPGVVLKEGQENTDPTCPTDGNCPES
jgi:FtsP/CotA-like multicopper oxidase with cupredoxin domain